MCKEYSKPSGDPSEFLYSEQIADSFHNPSIFLPDQLYNKYPAHVRIDLLARAHVSILKVLILKALQTGCSTGGTWY
jgi:hypothetical protein